MVAVTTYLLQVVRANKLKVSKVSWSASGSYSREAAFGKSMDETKWKINGYTYVNTCIKNVRCITYNGFPKSTSSPMHFSQIVSIHWATRFPL